MVRLGRKRLVIAMLCLSAIMLLGAGVASVKKLDLALSFVIEEQAVQAELGAERITVSGSVTRLPFRLYLPRGTVSIGERVFRIDELVYLGRTHEGVAQYSIEFGRFSSGEMSGAELVGAGIIVVSGDVTRNQAEWAFLVVTSRVYPYPSKGSYLIPLK